VRPPFATLARDYSRLSRKFERVARLIYCVRGRYRSGPIGKAKTIDRANENGVDPGEAALSPLRAFIVLAAVAVIAGGAIIGASGPDRFGNPRDWSREAGPARPAPSASKSEPEGGELTEGEALALFERLRRRLEAAYRRRSVRTLLEAVDRDSPQFAQSMSDLRLLERNNLLDRTRSRRLETRILEIDPGRVVVSERSAVRPRYLDDATYVEIDLKIERTRSSAEWILERRGDRWVITSSRASG
jgi:hypothetical protein